MQLFYHANTGGFFMLSVRCGKCGTSRYPVMSTVELVRHQPLPCYVYSKASAKLAVTLLCLRQSQPHQPFSCYVYSRASATLAIIQLRLQQSCSRHVGNREVLSFIQQEDQECERGLKKQMLVGQSTTTQILIGQRARIINWCTERGKPVEICDNTKRHLLKKRIIKRLKRFT